MTELEKEAEAMKREIARLKKDAQTNEIKKEDVGSKKEGKKKKAEMQSKALT
jgi:hypothetical protein